MADGPREATAMQFDDAAQQRHAAALGMWTFLVTELMLFGGLFTGYAAYRLQYPEAFAEASRHLYLWIAVANTAVLLVSSFTMATGVQAARSGSRSSGRWFGATALLGCAFLAAKAVEYLLDARDGIVPGPGFAVSGFADPVHAQLFLVFYFVMTGLHALHVAAGVGVVGVVAWRLRRGEATANQAEMTGLYWHFVDIVWIFLLPLLYLVA